MAKARIGSGAPSFCWVCHKQLQRAPGKTKGLFYFELVRDRLGADHRVHQSVCLPQAVADGNQHVRETAK
ncbi:hypothetical protein [Curvibacter phage PCA1]|nr:hypothetical protein [Curvibacter phage PCA1]